MKSRWVVFFIGLDFIITGLVFMFIFGQITELSCEKPEEYVTQCTVERKLLGALTVSSKTFLDVDEAWVESSCDDDGCTYRVMLSTSDGQEPMTRFFSSGENAKVNTANGINGYIHSDHADSFLLSEESGLFIALFPLVFVLIGLYVIIVKGIFQPMR